MRTTKCLLLLAWVALIVQGCKAETTNEEDLAEDLTVSELLDLDSTQDDEEESELDQAQELDAIDQQEADAELPDTTSACGDQSLESCLNSGQACCTQTSQDCSAGGADCLCLATDEDLNHCGGCGIACAAGRLCVSGSCVCPDGGEDCDLGDQAYLAQVVTTPVEVDGDISSYSTAAHIKLVDSTTGASAWVAFAWDYDFLYMAAEIVDQELLVSAEQVEDGQLWNDDSIELSIDALGEGGDSMDENDYKFFINVNNLHMDEQGGDYDWDSGFVSVVERSGSVNSSTDTDVGYRVEAAIPWSDMGITPQNGASYGLELVLNDQVSELGRSYTAWSNIDGGELNNPGGWGSLTLYDPEPPSEDCGDGFCADDESCASCASDCGSCDLPEPIFANDFETTLLEIDTWYLPYLDVGSKDTLERVSNPDPDGVNSSSMVMLASTHGDFETSRAEYHNRWDRTYPTQGHTHVYRWMVYFPEDYLENVVISTDWMLISQFVTSPCSNEAAVCEYGKGIFNEVRIDRDDHSFFNFEYRALPDCHDVPFVFPKGEWVELVQEVHWTTESTGYYGVWANGELLGSGSGIQTLPSGYTNDESCGIRWKVGLYSRWESAPGFDVPAVYYYVDNMALYLDHPVEEVCPTCASKD